MDVMEKLVEVERAAEWFEKRAENTPMPMARKMFELAGEVLREKANGVTVQEWISVKDRLPDIDGKYLVARAEGGRYSISVRKFRKEVPCWYTGYCGHWERRTNGITHWQYLPQPPKGE